MKKKAKKNENDSLEKELLLRVGAVFDEYKRVESKKIHYLRDNEKQAISLLVDAWNVFSVDCEDQDDLDDFRKAIHDAQRIVCVNVARRAEPEVFL